VNIDPDVQVIAHRWGLPAELLQAVVQAEGNIVKAVQCSIPSVQTRDEALQVLARSCTHAMADFIHLEDKDGFITFWAARWAPEHVANDPTHLNSNWAGNVQALWT
jgi:hypothetical protein